MLFERGGPRAGGDTRTDADADDYPPRERPSSPAPFAKWARFAVAIEGVIHPSVCSVVGCWERARPGRLNAAIQFSILCVSCERTLTVKAKECPKASGLTPFCLSGV